MEHFPNRPEQISISPMSEVINMFFLHWKMTNVHNPTTTGFGKHRGRRSSQTRNNTKTDDGKKKGVINIIGN